MSTDMIFELGAVAGILFALLVAVASSLIALRTGSKKDKEKVA